MAIGGGTFTAIGGGISDLFAASADRSKAQGDHGGRQLRPRRQIRLSGGAVHQGCRAAIQGMAAEETALQFYEPDQGGYCRWWLCSVRFRPRHPRAVRIAGRAAAGRACQKRSNSGQGYQEQAQSYLNMETSVIWLQALRRKQRPAQRLGLGSISLQSLASLLTPTPGGGGEPAGWRSPYYGGSVEG